MGIVVARLLWFWLVIIRIGSITLLTTSDILRQSIKIQPGNAVWLGRSDLWLAAQVFETVIRVETNLTDLVQFLLSLQLLVTLHQKLIKAQSWDRFHLLIKDLSYGVALTLKQMDQVHELFLS